MRQIYAVLREKEFAIKQVRREIAALRLACQLLNPEAGSTPDTVESGVGQEETTTVVPLTDAKKEALARIRAQLLDAGQKEVNKGTGSVLLQFRDVALGASRKLVKRVLDSRLLERDPQRKNIRDFFEWLGGSSAA